MNDRIRAGQTLPAAFAAELRNLRESRDPRYAATLVVARMNGWTYQSLAAALGISHQAVQQVVSRAPSVTAVHGRIPDVPLPPRKPQPEPKPPRRRLLVNDEVAAQLREMHRIAATVRGGTPSDAPERQVSIEFTAKLNALHVQGVTIEHLADVLGVTFNAVAARLSRHGYRNPYPSQIERYLGRPSEPQTHCKYGHELSGENLYVIPKSGRRICRACADRRRLAYLARKQQGGTA